MKMLLPIVMINFFSEADYIAGRARRKSKRLKVEGVASAFMTLRVVFVSPSVGMISLLETTPLSPSFRVSSSSFLRGL